MAGTRVGTGYVDVLGDWSKFDRSLATHGSMMRKNMSKLGGDMGASLTRAATASLKVGAVGVAGAFVYSLKKAGDFEQQLSSLGSVADANAKQMERFRKQALKAGADTKFSALEAAEAQTELAKGGLRVSQIMKGGLSASLALAAAGQMDLALAGETTVNVMKLFGLRGKDSMRIADGLATAANRTTADVSDFAIAFKQGGSAAKAAGLDFKETTAFLEALAEMGIKGSDAGTSMKAALTQLASPTGKAKELMKELGLEFFDADGNMKSLTAISGMLGDKLGGLNRQQRLQATTTLVGTDGMRALLALYDAGPQKIAKFQTELGKQGTAAKVAKEKQDNLKGSLEQLTGSLETLGINVGTMAIPAVRDLADDATELANTISRIVNRDDLDLGEKLNKILDASEVSAGPWIDKLESAIDEADLPGKLAEGVSAAAPVIASAAGKASLVAAGAFVDAWLNSDEWGRLFIAAVLIKKMGGLGAFRTAGTQAGAATATGMAAGVSGGGVKGKLAGAAKTLGKTVVAASLINGITEGIQATKSDLGLSDTITQIGHGASFGLFGADVTKEMEQDFTELRDAITRTTDLDMVQPISWDKLISTTKLNEQQRAALGSLLKFRRDAKAAVGELGQRGITIKIDDQDAVDTARRVTAALKRMESGSSTSIKQLRGSVRDGMAVIKRDLGGKSAEGKEALSANFQAAIKNVKTSMKAGTISTKEGTAEIARLMRRALAVYGIKGKDAARYMASPTGDITGKHMDNPGQAGPKPGAQRGGLFQFGRPGDRGPDDIAARIGGQDVMVGSGEVAAVFNRHQLPVVNQRLADMGGLAGLFKQVKTPHNFAGGGMVPKGGFPDAMGALPGMDALAWALSKKFGLHVSSGSRPGAITTSGNPSDHGWGGAIDVTNGITTPQMDAANSWLDTVMGSAIKQKLYRTMVGGDHFNHIHVALQQAFANSAAAVMRLIRSGGDAMFGPAPKLARVLIDGPDSALKGVVQGAVDVTRGAAQSRLDSIAQSMMSSTGSITGPGGTDALTATGNGADLMRQISGQRGWNFADWWTID
ncbi:MAG TPA: phage tail tape measure protein, partial [Vicinamibacterales bacterium]|nr:phage tail tape measure protein [Vicinamibacterales bacterium]